MHKGAEETAAFCRALRDQLEWVDGVDVAVCPPFLSLHAAVQSLAGTDIAVAAQNVHWEPEGPFTGEVSASMLFELGVYGAIVGHSERRQLFGETDEGVARRAAAGLEAGLWIIACVGETEAERDAGDTFRRIETQLAGGLQAVATAELPALVIAYEPVWAIGTGRTATPAQAQEVHAHIRSWLRAQHGDPADQLRIQYGGSVKASNAEELMRQADIDGALVGGASLEAADFVAIVKAARPGR
jgi:triosephosphate isomerase